jgi:hypothetical protein
MRHRSSNGPFNGDGLPTVTVSAGMAPEDEQPELVRDVWREQLRIYNDD